MSGYHQPSRSGGQQPAQHPGYSGPSHGYANLQQVPQYGNQQARYPDPAYQQRQPQPQSYQHSQSHNQHQAFPPSPPSTNSNPSSPSDCSSYVQSATNQETHH
ncbi:hypothetical protein LTR95_006855 [Oleoguttula sp. CCFEE 5521]